MLRIETSYNMQLRSSIAPFRTITHYNQGFSRQINIKTKWFLIYVAWGKRRGRVFVCLCERERVSNKMSLALIRHSIYYVYIIYKIKYIRFCKENQSKVCVCWCVVVGAPFSHVISATYLLKRCIAIHYSLHTYTQHITQMYSYLLAGCLIRGH